jgi:hypothetical protein
MQRIAEDAAFERTFARAFRIEEGEEHDPPSERSQGDSRSGLVAKTHRGCASRSRRPRRLRLQRIRLSGRLLRPVDQERRAQADRYPERHRQEEEAKR